MNYQKINENGLLEKVLEDNGVKLNRHQLEIIDIIDNGTDEEFQELVVGRMVNVTSSLKEIFEKIVEDLSGNSPEIHLYDDTISFAKESNEDFDFNKNIGRGNQ